MIPREDPEPIIGEADCFLAVLERVSRVAPLRKPVLIIGERGTGKELIAARVHILSERWSRPFLKFNCAALNEELLESELFGHVAGAFTGAMKSRAGRFEMADGGTLFLDEIASMSPRLQEKLLRVIEYGTFERVGSSQTQKVDVRLIGAANQDLPSLARDGRFREDLLDRLSFDVLTLPPLRERGEDIPLLAQAFAEAMSRELGRDSFAGFSAEALATLAAHAWPGNVRELRNVVERAVYRMENAAQPVQRIELDPFESPYRPRASIASAPIPVSAQAPTPVVSAQPPADFRRAVDAFEIELIRTALADARFNQRKAAQKLALSYHQFRGLLRKYGLLKEARG